MPTTISDSETLNNYYSKQRVIDRFVVGYGATYDLQLSVTPAQTLSGAPDILVYVNNTEIYSIADQENGYGIININGNIIVDLEAYLTNLLTTTQLYPPVVEIHTYSTVPLDPNTTGY